MIINAASPFDILASSYDSDFTISAIGRLQRERVWHYLQGFLNLKQGQLKILEINCGTGEDAIRLAALGHSVIASDASGVMIEKAKEKLAALNADLPVDFVVSSFNELPTLFANEQFDLIFSNFGGLNCIERPALERLNKDLCYLTKPGGHLFLVVMGRCCLWEIFYYGIRGKFKTAFRKFSGSVDFTVNESTMPVYYYSPADVKKIFTIYFSFLQQRPVGLFIPPSYLERKLQSRRHWLNRLNKLEKRLSYSFLSSFADHFCVNFKKMDS